MKLFIRLPLELGMVTECSVIPFRVSNAPGVFMEYMNITFHPFLDKFVMVFIDDILSYYKSDEEHA